MMHQTNTASLCRSWTGGLLVVLLLTTTSCLGNPEDPGQDSDQDPDFQVLFIGNSLTFWNDLPGVLTALIDSAGAGSALINSLAVGGFSLEDHWKQGTARNAIALGGWDVVVLQQGASASPEGRQLLLEYTQLFSDDAAAVGASTALYMVWPSASRIDDFDDVSQSYLLAAEQVGGLLYPVGEAWRIAWQRDPDLELYDSDGIHPNRAATYLAALVMFQQLTGRSPIGLPPRVALPNLNTVGAPDSVAALLQEVALEANASFALP